MNSYLNKNIFLTLITLFSLQGCYFEGTSYWWITEDPQFVTETLELEVSSEINEDDAKIELSIEDTDWQNRPSPTKSLRIRYPGLENSLVQDLNLEEPSFTKSDSLELQSDFFIEQNENELNQFEEGDEDAPQAKTLLWEYTINVEISKFETKSIELSHEDCGTETYEWSEFEGEYEITLISEEGDEIVQRGTFQQTRGDNDECYSEPFDPS